MEIVYMGLLSKIFNAIFDAILSPVFKFLSSLLETVLGWLFRAVLQPLLQNILWPIFKGVVELVFEILAGVIYGIFASILELIDAMQTVFNIFSGIQPVGYSGQTHYPMLELIFRMDPIQKAVLIVSIISFVLMMMFSAVAMARSMLELDVDHLRPVSKVLSSTMKAMIRFALIPISCMFLIMMSSKLLVGIESVFETNQTSLGRMVFIVSSLDASKRAEYNISGKVKDSDKPVKPSENIGANSMDPIRWDYYTGAKDYSNMDTVEQDFNFARFDYMIGFVASIFLIIVLAISLLSFVCRIFDVILLFVASPFFVSSMPLDDGERFRNWSKMFVGKLFSGYGTVLGMNLYMMLCPSVMTGKLSFGTAKSTEADYLIRLIFIAGGAWAVIKSGPTITQILSEEAAGSEREASRTAAGFVTATAMGSVQLAGDVWTAGKQGYQSFRSQRQLQDNERQERIRKNLAKSGSFGGGGIAGIAGSSGGTGIGSGSAGRTESGSAAEPGISRERVSSGSGSGEGSGEASNTFTGENGSGPMSETSGTESSTSEEESNSEPGDITEESVSEGAVSESRTVQDENRKPPVQFIGGGRHFQFYKNEDGKSRLSVDFGKLFSISRGRDGSQRISMLGFGRKKDASGNIKVYSPVLELKKMTGSGSDGKLHMSKLNLGVLQVKRIMGSDGAKGKIYLKDLLGGTVRKRYDKETGTVETLSSFGTHYAKDSSGRYVKTDRNFLFFHEEYKQNQSGKYQVSHCSFLRGDEQSFHINRETGERSLKNWTKRDGRNVYTSEASRLKNEKKQEKRKDKETDG